MPNYEREQVKNLLEECNGILKKRTEGLKLATHKCEARFCKRNKEYRKTYVI